LEPLTSQILQRSQLAMNVSLMRKMPWPI